MFGIIRCGCVLFAIFAFLAVQLPAAQHGSEAASAGLSSANPAAAPPRQPGDAWAPPDVDAVAPRLISPAACSLATVLAGAGERVQETAGNLDRFTATESVQHQSVNGSGKLGKVQPRKYEYLVSIKPARNGYLSMQEFRSQQRRSRSAEAGEFPDRIATEGTPILVLVFHPLYARDFDMHCQGLSSWNGQPAWLVRFEQRAGSGNHLSNVVVKNKLYRVRLRGRAWILADSYQVARLETDLAEPIPQIKLRLEHIDVEYRPVQFAERQTQLWLPSTAELYLDFAGRRFYRKHSFSNFTLFSVNVEQQFAGVSAPEP